ncbi:MAG: NUDIX hydrolase [Candidatus Woesearchaeota archaeon]|nr:NUDIX hydrolase [Candidatus Woesearchaeota archaeon]
MNIPTQAKKVFTGEIFSVYQWEQKLFDDSTTTFEACKRPDTVQVIPIHDGKPVLLKEEQPHIGEFYGLVGGRIDEGEEPLAAAERELREETGMQSDHWELFKKTEYEGKIEWNTYYYIARDCTNATEQHLEPGEKIELIECSVSKFLRIVHKENFRNRDFLFHILQMEHNHELEGFKRKLT